MGLIMYGNKRNYRKIDIYVFGVYRFSTTWAKTLKEAIEHCGYPASSVMAKYAETKARKIPDVKQWFLPNVVRV